MFSLLFRNPVPVKTDGNPIEMLKFDFLHLHGVFVTEGLSLVKIRAEYVILLLYSYSQPYNIYFEISVTNILI